MPTPHPVIVLPNAAALDGAALAVPCWSHSSFIATLPDGERVFLSSRRITALTTDSGSTYCIALASRQPVFDAARRALVWLLQARSPLELLRRACAVTMELPMPLPGCRVDLLDDSEANSARARRLLSLSAPHLGQHPHAASGANLRLLFTRLPARTIIDTIAYLMSEQRVLLHIDAERSGELPELCAALVTLLYPLTWACPLIPALPEGIDVDAVLSAPQPVLVGMSSERWAREIGGIDTATLAAVVVVDIQRGTVTGPRAVPEAPCAAPAIVADVPRKKRLFPFFKGSGAKGTGGVAAIPAAPPRHEEMELATVSRDSATAPLIPPRIAKGLLSSLQPFLRTWAEPSSIDANSHGAHTVADDVPLQSAEAVTALAKCCAHSGIRRTGAAATTDDAMFERVLAAWQPPRFSCASTSAVDGTGQVTDGCRDEVVAAELEVATRGGVLRAFADAMVTLFGDYDAHFKDISPGGIDGEHNTADNAGERTSLGASAARYLGLRFDAAAAVTSKPEAYAALLTALFRTQSWDVFLAQRLAVSAWTDPEVLYFDALADSAVLGAPSPFFMSAAASSSTSATHARSDGYTTVTLSLGKVTHNGDLGGQVRRSEAPDVYAIDQALVGSRTVEDIVRLACARSHVPYPNGISFDDAMDRAYKCPITSTSASVVSTADVSVLASRQGAQLSLTTAALPSTACAIDARLTRERLRSRRISTMPGSNSGMAGVTVWSSAAPPRLVVPSSPRLGRVKEIAGDSDGGDDNDAPAVAASNRHTLLPLGPHHFGTPRFSMPFHPALSIALSASAVTTSGARAMAGSTLMLPLPQSEKGITNADLSHDVNTIDAVGDAVTAERRHRHGRRGGHRRAITRSLVGSLLHPKHQQPRRRMLGRLAEAQAIANAESTPPASPLHTTTARDMPYLASSSDILRCQHAGGNALEPPMGNISHEPQIKCVSNQSIPQSSNARQLVPISEAPRRMSVDPTGLMSGALSIDDGECSCENSIVATPHTDFTPDNLATTISSAAATSLSASQGDRSSTLLVSAQHVMPLSELEQPLSVQPPHVAEFEEPTSFTACMTANEDDTTVMSCSHAAGPDNGTTAAASTEHPPSMPAVSEAIQPRVQGPESASLIKATCVDDGCEVHSSVTGDVVDAVDTLGISNMPSPAACESASADGVREDVVSSTEIPETSDCAQVPHAGDEVRLVATPAALAAVSAEVQHLKLLLRDSERQRQRLAAALQDARGNVRIVVRVRPAPFGDIASSAVAVASETQLNVVRPAVGVNAATNGSSISLVSFDFDRVLDTTVTQTDVFSELQGSVAGVVEAGKNACIMAYGQTGSGKTYTMNCGPLDTPLPLEMLRMPAPSRSGGNPSLPHAAGAPPHCVICMSSVDNAKVDVSRELPSECGVYARAAFTIFDRLHARWGCHMQADPLHVADGIGSTPSPLHRPCPWEVRLGVFEIYNEELRDLLGPVLAHLPGCNCGGCNGLGRRADRIVVRHEASTARGSAVAHPTVSYVGLTCPVVTSPTMALALLAAGTAGRATSSNGVNHRSSRSHAIVIFFVKQTETRNLGLSLPGGGGSGQSVAVAAAPSLSVAITTEARLVLVDLAGSERANRVEAALAAATPTTSATAASATTLSRSSPPPQSTIAGGFVGSHLVAAVSSWFSSARAMSTAGGGEMTAAVEPTTTATRHDEGTRINASLTVLGRVIGALVQASEAPSSSGVALHIPYRDSQLTYALSDCLGGNSRTTVLVTVSPDPSDARESLSSLEFAARARSVKARAVANVVTTTTSASPSSGTLSALASTDGRAHGMRSAAAAAAAGPFAGSGSTASVVRRFGTAGGVTVSPVASVATTPTSVSAAAATRGGYAHATAIATLRAALAASQESLRASRDEADAAKRALAMMEAAVASKSIPCPVSVPTSTSDGAACGVKGDDESRLSLGVVCDGEGMDPSTAIDPTGHDHNAISQDTYTTMIGRSPALRISSSSAANRATARTGGGGKATHKHMRFNTRKSMGASRRIAALPLPPSDDDEDDDDQFGDDVDGHGSGTDDEQLRVTDAAAVLARSEVGNDTDAPAAPPTIPRLRVPLRRAPATPRDNANKAATHARVVTISSPATPRQQIPAMPRHARQRAAAARLAAPQLRAGTS